MKVAANEQTRVRAALEGIPSNIHFHANSNGIRTLLADYLNPNVQHLQSEFFYQRVVGMRPLGIGDDEYIRRYETRHESKRLFSNKTYHACAP